MGYLGHDNQTGEITDSQFATDDVQRKVHVRQDYTGVWGGRGEAMLGGPIMRKAGLHADVFGKSQSLVFYPGPRRYHCLTIART